MTRRMTYDSQLAISLFQMQDQKEAMVEKAKLAQAILGTSTLVDGFDCVPTSPASLNVDLDAITLFSFVPTDASPFGQLPTQIPADPSEIFKLAYLNNPTVPNFTPPGTAGFSRNDIIQVTFEEIDDTPTEIPFWNSSNPSAPIFQTKNVLRSDKVIVSVKQGVAAATGTQTTPTPDPGYLALWVITTTNGQATITSSDIQAYTNTPSPFILEKLQDKISIATGDARYALKTDVPYPAGYLYGAETSTNATNATIQPAKGRSDLDDQNIILASAITKTLSAWTEGNSLGGVASAVTPAVGMTLHYFLISKADGTVDAGFDNVLTATNLLATATGYLFYRRIASYKLNASVQFPLIIQRGDTFLYKSPPSDLQMAIPNTIANLLTLSLPSGFPVEALMNVRQFSTSTTTGVYISSPDVNDLAVSGGASPYASAGLSVNTPSSPANETLTSQVRCFTNSSGQIRYRVATASQELDIATLGYVDTRGRI